MMVSDLNGFSYPSVDTNQCVECERCRNACPVLSPSLLDATTVPESLASWAKDSELRRQSSSGGLFSVLAEHVLSKSGVAYGVVFDAGLKTVFARADFPDAIAPMRGAKYIEADTENLFRQVADDLKRGIPVLFSGTPCQNAALKRYVAALGLSSSLLYQIDFICHGVSSPALWKSFVEAIESKYHDKLKFVYFRDKSIGGWKSPAIRFSFQNRKDMFVSWSTVRLHVENAFISCYHKNLSLRESCSHCRCTGLPRHADITLGDAQMLYHHPEFRTQARNGISMILLNTPKGKTLLDEVSTKIIYTSRPIAESRLSLSPAILHPRREQFLNDAQKLVFPKLIKKYSTLLKPPFRIGTILNGIMKSVLGYHTALSLREYIESVLCALPRNKR